MIGDYFYHGLLQKYVVLFGTLFNDINVQRDSGAKEMKVPISFAPRQKILVRAQQDPKGERKTAARLPLMSFEITGYQYAPERKRQRREKSAIRYSSDGEYSDITGFVPWNINFDLNIFTTTQEDALKIVGQILPYFDPDWVVRAQILEQFPDKVIDVPVVLTGQDVLDTYEDNFEKRRMLIYTLHFTMQAQFFGPVKVPKVIKIAFVDFYTKDDMAVSETGITTRPGLTADGEPTTDIAETIPYLDIEKTDDWGVIVTVRDEPR